MNYSNRNIDSDRSIHDSCVVENAIKNAIHVVVDIVYKVNDGKIREYQMMLNERDKEISRLELRLKQTEDELSLLQSECKVNTNTFTANCVYSMTNEQGLEVEFPCVGARSPLVFSLNQDGMAAEPSNQEDPEQQSHSSSSQAGITDCLSLARQGTSPVVKEEPPVFEPVHIKPERFEQGCDQQHRPKTPNSKRKTRAENQRQYRKRCRATPEGREMLKERDRLSYYKKRVLVSQMSEEAKRQKRAKWRAAQRRARDRKRFQEGLSQVTSHFVQADHSLPHNPSNNTAKPEGTPRHRRGRPRKGGQVEVTV